MKRLTEQEISFIKDTGWTPTLHQMGYSENELKRTHLYQVQNIPVSPEMMQLQFESFANQYGFDLHDLYEKTCNLENSNSISLEYEATYLLYTFFTSKELLEMNNTWALNWLQDFKYYFGFRKWFESDVEVCIQEALSIYAGTREFYEQDGEMWNREVEIDESDNEAN